MAGQHVLDAAEEALLQRRAGADHARAVEYGRQQHRALPRADVDELGDLVDLTGYPVIDVKAGGSIDSDRSRA